MTLTVWQRAQAWVGDDALGELGDVDATLTKVFARPPVGAGFSALHVKLHDGALELNRDVVPMIRSRLRALGLRGVVGGWGFNAGSGEHTQDPRADAEKANGLILREKCDYWIANVEFQYKAPSLPDGSPDTSSPKYLANRIFVARFRELRPTFPLGMAGMPNEPMGGYYDWDAWKGNLETGHVASARWLPECYPNEFPNESAIWPGAPSVPGAVAVGARIFPAALVHPTLGLYGDVRAQAYVNSLFASKAQGFTYGYSVYLIHNLTDADWAVFGAVNKPFGSKSALAWYPA